jgi:hypothetical protein
MTLPAHLCMPRLLGRAPTSSKLFGEPYRHHSTTGPSYCMLGLRPRLKHRPSLLDLIQRHNLEAGPITTTPNSASIDDELPTKIPLPASPASPRKIRANSKLPTTPVRSRTLPSVRLLSPPPPPPDPPVKKTEMPAAKTESDENTGKVFSVSGPVIVAEDMIGCAMYELVCIYALLDSCAY